MLITGIVMAVVVPLLFAAFVRWLDVYASSSFKIVLLSFGWGMIAFLLAFLVNPMVLGLAGYAPTATFFAPMVEEIAKSLILVYIVQRRDFTYFVDGAIYGFAVGACFAVLENVWYLLSADARMGLALGFGRAFSTALMHGSATALVGIALGRLRYGRGTGRFASLFLGWAAAMGLHIAFNYVTTHSEGGVALVLAVLLGLGGVGLVIALIFWGLAVERRWLYEMLGPRARVSFGEAAIVQKLDALDILLAPVSEHFGAERCKQAETFLKMQAQLGLKYKVLQMTPDPQQRAEIEAQIRLLQGEIDHLRRGLGAYCMAYIRSILPPDTTPLWERLKQAIEARGSSGGPSVWDTLEGKVAERGRDDKSHS